MFCKAGKLETGSARERKQPKWRSIDEQ